MADFTPCLDDPSQPIATKIGIVGGIEEVTIRAKFGVDRLIGAGSAGSRNVAVPFKRYMTGNNLPCTTVQACDQGQLQQ